MIITAKVYNERVTELGFLLLIMHNGFLITCYCFLYIIIHKLLYIDLEEKYPEYLFSFFHDWDNPVFVLHWVRAHCELWEMQCTVKHSCKSVPLLLALLSLFQWVLLAKVGASLCCVCSSADSFINRNQWGNGGEKWIEREQRPQWAGTADSFCLSAADNHNFTSEWYRVLSFWGWGCVAVGISLNKGQQHGRKPHALSCWSCPCSQIFFTGAV